MEWFLKHIKAHAKRNEWNFYYIIYLICLIISKKNEKRARDFIRFGKRGDEDMEDTFANDQSQTMQFPYKRFGRRRMSNFLRFG